MLTKAERIALILQTLNGAQTPPSAEAALQAISDIVDAVENEHSGVPYEAEPGLKYEGRMYGPRPDKIKTVPGGTVARTAGNYIYCFNDGSYVVLTLKGKVVACNHHPL